MFQKTQFLMVAISAIGSVGALLAPNAKDEKARQYSSPEQPHFVSAPADKKPKAESEDSDFRGSGYGYNDPLEDRVVKLENDMQVVKKAIELVNGGKTPAAAVTEAASKPAVESKTTQVDSLTVRAGQTPEEVVKALQAAGYKANVTYGSYGSTGSSATYSSGGSSGGSKSAVSYAYPETVQSYSYPVQQSYSYPVQTQATYAYPVQTQSSYRVGLFGRVYSSQPTCRMVNGQMICN